MNPAKSYAEIAFPIPSRKLFSYRVPDRYAGTIQPGCRVYAPLGNRKVLGYIASLADRPSIDLKDMKSIHEPIDQEPLFGPELFRFLRWVSDYYLSSLGETFAAAYPFSPSVKPRMIKVVVLDDAIQSSGQVPETISHTKQRHVLEFLINRKALLSPADIVREVGVSSSTIRTLEKKGWIHLETKESHRIPVYSSVEETSHPFLLTEEQESALEAIKRAWTQTNPRPFLLHGVTGSGKTEVYLQAIEQCLAQGKTALVLLPEISLTPQTMDRFRSRFGTEAGILHSGLGQGERFDEWRLTKQGKRRIVVGTRSAIFAPLENLGIIIVDEEHDGSYKQSDPSPRYHARDLAVARAHLSGSLCVLGSATPATESTYNVKRNKYQLVQMKKRIAPHGMPHVQLVDMRGRSEEEEILSQEMQDALWDRFEKKQQSILFLNRRGFATTLSCQHCGHIITCSHCSVAMVYHRHHNMLICHHCDARASIPDHCSSCTETFIRQRGFGTERVVHELEKILPAGRVIRLDRDTTQKKGDHDRLLTPFRKGEADILVGTQMIAKGLDFPQVTLVGIINADYSLSLPDFRASERTFFLLTQVAGRSGRGVHAGEVLIQTYCPNHYSIQLALNQDYEAFYEKEIRYRRLIGFPPFSRLVLWRIEASMEDVARGKAWELYTLLQEGLREQAGVTLLPPVEAPLYRLRDYYRWQVALKSRDHRAFRPLLSSEALQSFLSQRRKHLRIIQDVDPFDML